MNWHFLRALARFENGLILYVYSFLDLGRELNVHNTLTRRWNLFVSEKISNKKKDLRAFLYRFHHPLYAIFRVIAVVSFDLCWYSVSVVLALNFHSIAYVNKKRVVIIVRNNSKVVQYSWNHKKLVPVCF